MVRCGNRGGAVGAAEQVGTKDGRRGVGAVLDGIGNLSGLEVADHHAPIRPPQFSELSGVHRRLHRRTRVKRIAKSDAGPGGHAQRNQGSRQVGRVNAGSSGQSLGRNGHAHAILRHQARTRRHRQRDIGPAAPGDADTGGVEVVKQVVRVRRLAGPRPQLQAGLLIIKVVHRREEREMRRGEVAAAWREVDRRTHQMFLAQPLKPRQVRAGPQHPAACVGERTGFRIAAKGSGREIGERVIGLAIRHGKGELRRFAVGAEDHVNALQAADRIEPLGDGPREHAARIAPEGGEDAVHRLLARVVTEAIGAGGGACVGIQPVGEQLVKRDARAVNAVVLQRRRIAGRIAARAQVRHRRRRQRRREGGGVERSGDNRVRLVGRAVDVPLGHRLVDAAVGLHDHRRLNPAGEVGHVAGAKPGRVDIDGGVVVDDVNRDEVIQPRHRIEIPVSLADGDIVVEDDRHESRIGHAIAIGVGGEEGVVVRFELIHDRPVQVGTQRRINANTIVVERRISRQRLVRRRIAKRKRARLKVVAHLRTRPRQLRRGGTQIQRRDITTGQEWIDENLIHRHSINARQRRADEGPIPLPVEGLAGRSKPRLAAGKPGIGRPQRIDVHIRMTQRLIEQRIAKNQTAAGARERVVQAVHRAVKGIEVEERQR